MVSFVREMEALKNVISSQPPFAFLRERICRYCSVDDKKRFIKLLRLILLSSNFA